VYGSSTEYELQSPLGSGTHGRVFAASALDGSAHAIKLVPDKEEVPLPSATKGGIPGNSVHTVENEATAMRECAGPGVLQLREVIKGDGATALVLEKGNMDLYDFLMLTMKHSHGPPSESSVKGIFRSLVEAVAGIHKKGWVHRDLKLENVLLVGNELKLCDFGLATKWACDKETGEPRELSTPCGSLNYVAPELIKETGRSYDGRLADTWSLGVMLFVMVAGQYPWEVAAMRDNHFLAYTKGAPQWPSHFSPMLRHLLQTIFTSKNRRCLPQALLSHPWLLESTLPASSSPLKLGNADTTATTAQNNCKKRKLPDSTVQDPVPLKLLRSETLPGALGA